MQGVLNLQLIPSQDNVIIHLLKRGELMYVKNPKKRSRTASLEMSIIFAIIVVSTVVSLVLPVYFAYLSLNGS